MPDDPRIEPMARHLQTLLPNLSWKDLLVHAMTLATIGDAHDTLPAVAPLLDRLRPLWRKNPWTGA